MLYYLEAKRDDSVFYLLPNRTYIVGRKEADLILKDGAVSRKHAQIIVNEIGINVVDCGSTFGTFINDTKVRVNIPNQLEDGNVIKFGLGHSIYILHKISIVTTTSGIKGEQKLILKNNLDNIGGVMTPDYSEYCTHLTVDVVLLTIKILSAIIAGTPIVTLQYWNDYVKAVKNNALIPNPKDYTPKCSEAILDQNVSLEYKIERKQLFKDKTFVFALTKDNVQMQNMIKLSGGNSISWQENPIPSDAISEEMLKNYIVIQNDSSDTAKTCTTLQSFISKYTELGKRTIPLQEIPLAIINCSCEKNCNPNFDRKALVFKTNSCTEKKEASEKFLAMPSQTLDMCGLSEVKSESIIPQTCDTLSKIEVVDDFPVIEKKLYEKTEKSLEIINVSSGSKRNSPLDENENDNNTKKIKIDQPLSPNQTFTKSVITTVESRGEPSSAKSTGKSLFAFKHEKIASTEETPFSYANPFAKKRKAQEDIVIPTKKPVFLSNTSTFTPPTNNSVVINPFSNILKPKKEKDIKFTSTPRDPPTDAANSLEINFSVITAVDSVLEKSFRWITKNSNTTVCTLEDKKSDENFVDKELLIFINSFKNSVIVEEEKDLVVRKSGEVNVSDQSLNDSTIKNFKRFRKVQPLRMQTTIVPESSYASIICNQRRD